jgi:hypothetical protein
MLGEDYGEECERKLCPTKQVCKRLKNKNEGNPYEISYQA